MRFNPKSEEEIAASGLFPAGEYDFEILTATETTSKAGNDMTTLEVRLHDTDGSTTKVWDYLVDTERAAYKIRHFAEAVGLIAQYETGELLTRDMEGRTGRCKVNIVKSAGYADKNGISDYVTSKKERSPSSSPRQKAPAGDIDDEIPF